jgi:Uma2 family endonuclease
MAIGSLITNEIYYPDSDGQPVGETPLHIRNLRYVIEPLEQWFAGDPHTCVAGNMFVYYEEGNPRKHVSPDVFVSRNVAAKSEAERRRYLVWEEGKAPDAMIELTSESTADEDQKTKFVLYRDTLRVREYFLFDPNDEYLQPRLQGFRLLGKDYVRIEPVDGRLPSEVLGLHLEGDGPLLRFYDPIEKARLPIPPEQQAAQQQAAEERAREAQARQLAEAARIKEEQARREAEAARIKEEQARREAEAARIKEEQARQAAEAEVKRLQHELEELRRRLP